MGANMMEMVPYERFLRHTPCYKYLTISELRLIISRVRRSSSSAFSLPAGGGEARQRTQVGAYVGSYVSFHDERRRNKASTSFTPRRHPKRNEPQITASL